MKKKQNGDSFSRRKFIGTSFSLATSFAFLHSQSLYARSFGLAGFTHPDSLIRGVQIGVITYSYRSMPHQDVRDLLKDIVKNNISAVELMGDPAERFAGKPENPADQRLYNQLRDKTRKGHLSPEEEKQWKEIREQEKEYRKKISDWRSTVSMEKYIQLRKMFNEAGVSIYAWKPGAFDKGNTDSDIHYAFNVAKALGARACTAEHPRGQEAAAQTARLGKIAAQHKIYMAYHAHTQASPTLWDTALKQSKWNAINLDLGHWVAAGNPDPIPFIKKYHQRIESMHLKDRTTPEHGAGNLFWGKGDTPITKVLQFMRDEKYTFPASIELEYKIPDDSDAVKEISRCLQYCRQALES